MIELRTEFLEPCSEEDFLKFEPPERTSFDRAKRYREEASLYCLDWKKSQFKLLGSPSDAFRWCAGSALQLSCDCKQRKRGPIRDDCNLDRDAAIEYIGDTNVVTYYNTGRFLPNEFQEPVQRYSVVHKMRFDPLRANWFKTYVETQTLQDEVKLF